MLRVALTSQSPLSALRVAAKHTLPTISTTLHKKMSTKYPTAAEITAMFKPFESGDYAKSFANVVDDVDWTVMGTQPLGGHYNNLQDFQKKTFARLGAIMPKGLNMTVRQAFGGSDSPWATLELVAQGGLKFDNTYAWVIKFNEERKIVLVRAYLDSLLVKQALEQNEEGPVEDHRAPITLTP
ncbi:hypothetical protein MRB53_041914 [Persea americana]|nr:hypothetical protein MRB53_041914 [Persea americana]